jgi:NADH dehydrogenase
LSTDDFRVTLVELAAELLGGFRPHLRRYAMQQLKRRGLDVRRSTAVTEVTAEGLCLSDCSMLHADVIIWASGVAARPEIAGWNLPSGAGGRILVDDTLRVIGSDDIYAVGDCALTPTEAVPQLAAPAIQMGRHAANEIIGELRGAPRDPPARAAEPMMTPLHHRNNRARRTPT